MKLIKQYFLPGLAASVCVIGQTRAQEPSGEAGKVSREVWWNIGGRNLELLWNQNKFYCTPDLQDQRDKLESPVNIGSNSGQRLRGYVVAPVTGEYRFRLSGDNHAALWLGNGESKFSKRKLIHFRGWTGHRQWGKYRAQLSDPVQLEAGKRYYVEVQQKDTGGGLDHVSVGWSYVEGNGLVNWAREAGAVASQSSTSWGGVAARAIDGNTSGNYCVATITHTMNQAGSWWQVDFGSDRQIDRVELFNRNWNGWWCTRRLANFRISVLDGTGNVVASKDYHTGSGHTQAAEFWETGSVQGRIVKIELLGASRNGEHILSLAEVQVWGRADAAAAYQGFEIVPGAVLESYAGSLNDVDNDEYPDDWEIQHGFDASAYQGGDYFPLADPDKDGFTNLNESVLGTAPLQSSSVPGYLTTERWTGIQEYDVSDLVMSDAFFGEPGKRQAMASTSYRDIGAYSGARVRGYITAPESGVYHFWLSARNGGELWLSEDATKYRKRRLAVMGPEAGTGHGIVSWNRNLWDKFSSQMSEGIHLEAGQKYFLEMLTQQGHGGGYHVSVAWARPGQDREPLPLQVISSYGLEAEDADDDYLPDAWESQYGLSPADNGAIDREREGERGDYDLDGLSNREEYVIGTDPSNADTDGDGLNDAEEHRSYGTDPTRSDAPSEQLVGTVDLATYTNTGLVWSMTSEGLVPESFRGGIRWSFNVPAEGYWSLNIATRLLGDLYQHETVDVDLLIDGVSLGKSNLVYGPDRDALLRVITPMLSAGMHTLELKIDNMLARRMVSIRSIKVLEPQGADLDGDGHPDWVVSFLSGANTLKPYAAFSRTSPAFLEGTARSRASSALNRQPVHEGLDENHWYANLPLEAGGSTPFNLVFGDGLTATGNIQWQPTNVLDGGSIVIRKGDSLKLVVRPSTGTTGQAVTLTEPSAINWALAPGVSANQSTTALGGLAGRSIDGNTNGHWGSGSVTHSNNASGSWWKLDLGQERTISRIQLWNRQDCCTGRLSNYRISVSDASGWIVASQDFHVTSGQTYRKENWYLSSPVVGRKVKVELLGANREGNHILSLAEVQVFGNDVTELNADTEHYQRRFDVAGTHFVTASHSDGSTGQLIVHVKQADFEEAPQNLLSNTLGNIKVSGLSVDGNLHFEGGNAFTVRNGIIPSGDWFYLKADPRKRGSYNMLARLYPGGPVLGAKSLNLVGISDALQNDLVSGFLSRDFVGYTNLTSPVVATDLPVGGKVVVRIFRAGVTFPDGTKTRVLRSEDFINGVVYLDFLFPTGMAGGYCHHLDIYDRNGAYLGRR